MEREAKRRSRAVVAQRVVATLALLVALGAVGSTFRSFGALGTVGCGAPILGSKVEHQAPTSSFLYGREASVCARNGHSRLAIAGVVAVLALALGVAGWVRPLGLPWWLTGEDPPHLAGRREEDGDAGPGPGPGSPPDPGSPPSVRSSASPSRPPEPSATEEAGPARPEPVEEMATPRPAPAPAKQGPATVAPGDVPDPPKPTGWVSLRDRGKPSGEPPPASDRRTTPAPRRDGG